MKNKNLQIILVIFLVLVLPGGILALYFLKPKKSVSKTGSVETNEIWTTHVVNGEGNPSTLDDIEGLYSIDNLAWWFDTTPSEIYAFNPKLNKIIYIPYGSALQLPRK